MTVSMNGLSMPSIELTPSVMNGEMISNLNSEETSIAQLQEQLSTGNVVNQPSDNPALAANIMQINSALSRATSYSNNASDGLGWLQTGNSTMNEIVSTLQSVRQDVLSVSSASLAGSQAGLQALADQVNQAQQTLLNLANTSYNGQAIFAGTGNVTTAFDANGNYVGGGSAPTRTVAPGTSVSVSVTGDSGVRERNDRAAQHDARKPGCAGPAGPGHQHRDAGLAGQRQRTGPAESRQRHQHRRELRRPSWVRNTSRCRRCRRRPPARRPLSTPSCRGSRA